MNTADNKLDSVISKVKKLLALVENNTNENEIIAARSAADKLIQEYRISQAQLEASKEIHSEPFVRNEVLKGGRRLAWHETIINALCTHYGGAFYFSSRRIGGEHSAGAPDSKGACSYTVIARESDFAIIDYMLVYLVKETQNRAKEAKLGRAEMHAWRIGCANGIANQFARMRAEARVAAIETSTSQAMVILNNRAKESQDEMNKGVKLKTGAAVGNFKNYSAYLNGHKEGGKIEIRNGIGAAPTGSNKLLG